MRQIGYKNKNRRKWQCFCHYNEVENCFTSSILVPNSIFFHLYQAVSFIKQDYLNIFAKRKSHTQYVLRGVADKSVLIE